MFLKKSSYIWHINQVFQKVLKQCISTSYIRPKSEVFSSHAHPNITSFCKYSSPVLWRFLHFFNLVWQDLIYTKHHTKQNWKQRCSSYWNFNFKKYSFGNNFGHFHCCYIGPGRDNLICSRFVSCVSFCCCFFHSSFFEKLLSSWSCRGQGGHDFMKNCIALHPRSLLFFETRILQ